MTASSNTPTVSLHLAIVTAGVAALIARSATAVTVLLVAGAGYLLCLGTQALRSSRALTASEAPRQSWRRQAVAGFGVSGLNPRVFVPFLALLPQFTDEDGE